MPRRTFVIDACAVRELYAALSSAFDKVCDRA